MAPRTRLRLSQGPDKTRPRGRPGPSTEQRIVPVGRGGAEPDRYRVVENWDEVVTRPVTEKPRSAKSRWPARWNGQDDERHHEAAQRDDEQRGSEDLSTRWAHQPKDRWRASAAGPLGREAQAALGSGCGCGQQ